MTEMRAVSGAECLSDPCSSPVEAAPNSDHQDFGSMPKIGIRAVLVAIGFYALTSIAAAQGQGGSAADLSAGQPLTIEGLGTGTPTVENWAARLQQSCPTCITGTLIEPGLSPNTIIGKKIVIQPNVITGPLLEGNQLHQTAPRGFDPVRRGQTGDCGSLIPRIEQVNSTSIGVFNGLAAPIHVALVDASGNPVGLLDLAGGQVSTLSLTGSGTVTVTSSVASTGGDATIGTTDVAAGRLYRIVIENGAVVIAPI